MAWRFGFIRNAKMLDLPGIGPVTSTVAACLARGEQIQQNQQAVLIVVQRSIPGCVALAAIVV